MESLRRNFFNGSQEGEKKIAWVKWSNVLAPKTHGGLGVFSFFALNRALLAKWVWRFLSHDNSLWYRVISDIYVAAKLQGPLLSSFRRGVRGGAESHQYELLSSLLEPVILSNSVDRWVCDLNGEWAFKVKDIRLLIDESFLPNSDTPIRWVKSVLIKINVFAWKVSLDRLPTRFNLARRNVAVASTLSPICNQAPEDSSHLFCGCSMAKEIVALICRWWSLNLYLPSSYVD
nr:RNA-directed DNA polymerase, eukaryota [Tanacetum cinerariifolium]